jgi:hypothetical protein
MESDLSRSGLSCRELEVPLRQMRIVSYSFHVEVGISIVIVQPNLTLSLISIRKRLDKDNKGHSQHLSHLFVSYPPLMMTNMERLRIPVITDKVYQQKEFQFKKYTVSIIIHSGPKVSC